MYASNNACGLTLASIFPVMEPWNHMWELGSIHTQARARQFKPNYEMEPWNQMLEVSTPRLEPGSLSLLMKWNHGATCGKYTQARARQFKPNYEMEPWNHGTTCEKYKHPG
jgi:hypothetical protein